MGNLHYSPNYVFDGINCNIYTYESHRRRLNPSRFFLFLYKDSGGRFTRRAKCIFKLTRDFQIPITVHRSHWRSSMGFTNLSDGYFDKCLYYRVIYKREVCLVSFQWWTHKSVTFVDLIGSLFEYLNSESYITYYHSVTLYDIVLVAIFNNFTLTIMHGTHTHIQGDSKFSLSSVYLYSLILFLI